MINIEGKLIEKFETVQITETFKKREFFHRYVNSFPQGCGKPHSDTNECAIPRNVY